MATYLRIGPVGGSSTDIRIQGDVTAPGHQGWIEIDTFEFGTKPAPSEKDAAAEGEDGEEKEGKAAEARRQRMPASDESEKSKSASQRVHENGFKMKKMAGRESPKLLDWALKGETYDLQIDCCRDGAEAFMRVFVYKARVLSLSQDADEQEIAEDLEIVFETIAFEATSYGKDTKKVTSKRAATKAEKIVLAPTVGASLVAPGPGKAVGGRVDKTEAEEAVDELVERVQEGVEEDPDFVQEDRVLEIDAVNGIQFILGSVIGSEQLSGLFHFRLEVTSTNLQVAAADVIGKPVGFRIKDHADIDADRAASPREFHGIIAEIFSGQASVDHRDYTLIVVPWLWFLDKRTDCRIFQKKTVIEIVEAVFAKLGFRDYEKSNVRGTYPKLEYCVQYRESDFDFVSRLLEENGIFYFFTFANGSHKLILADGSVAHANCEQKDVSQSHGGLAAKHIRNWVKHQSHVSGKVTYRDYNHTTPTTDMSSAATSVVQLPGISSYEVYDYPGRYPKVSDGTSLVNVRMQAEEVAHCVVDGDSGCDAFAAGTKFKIVEHESADEKGKEYVLTGVRHQVRIMPMSDLKPRIYYENDFECIPKAVTFRPWRKTPRPRIAGPQTAVVVGVSGEEIDPDKYGSVKVQFHWDREGVKDENSSCFVRVAQPIAGKNWGGLWLPRIGQEVVVEFLEGDPDRPLITGSLYNEENLPPYALPANKTQSVIKTRSSKQGKAENFNELRFEDKAGSEHVYFHAEKDFQRVVENDDTLTVGKDGNGNQSITIEKDRTVTVKEGNESYTVKKGNRTVTVETGDDTLTVKQGKHTVLVETGDDAHTVKTGNRTVTVQTGNDTHAVKTGNREVTVDTGNDTLTIKLGNQTTKLNVGKSSTDAMQGIELKVGGNSIKLDQSGITIKGLMVKIEGSLQTDIKGLMTQINGSAMLKAGGGITMIG